MITFRARMYNVTSGEYLNGAPTEYSFAEYFGYTGTEEASDPSVTLLDWWLAAGGVGTLQPALAEDAGTDVMFGQEGRTLTNVPFTRFQFTRSTNIGTWIEYYAKKYYDAASAWPVLRLLTSNSIDSYYLEWNHSAPNGFYVKSDDAILRWNYSFQWSDSFNTQYTDDRKYNLYYSTVFIKSSEISDLINSATIKYAGAFRFNNTTGGVDTLVSDLPTVTVLKTDAPHLDSVTTASSPYFQTTGTKSRPVYTFYFNCYNLSYTENQFIIIAKFNRETPSPSIAYYCIIFSLEPIPTEKFSMSTGGTAPYYPFNNTSSTQFPMLNIVQGGPWYNTSDGYDLSTVRTIMNHYPLSYCDLGTYSSNDDVRAYAINDALRYFNTSVTYSVTLLYEYLNGYFSKEPPSDVEPTDIPPEDEPPTPIPPDEPDPYYDPTSDPQNPEYDPTKDPDNPSYDPTQPSTPWRPPTTEGGGNPPIQPIQASIEVPPVPPAFVTNNSMFTLYNPTAGDLSSLAAFLWSPQWSIDTFKKIFANPLDCILGLMVMPLLPATTSTKEMAVGNIATGVTMHYFTHQFYDFDCGTFKINEYYASYLDYAPYTKVNLYLPYIGDQQLNTDEVMNKIVGVKYRFDLATGDCVAFVSADGNVLYSFSGNCASRLPISGNNWSGMLHAITMGVIKAGSMPAGVPALGAAAALTVTSMKQDIAHSGQMSGSPGLMGIQTPYLIVTRPRQAFPLSQNSFTGYPSFMTETLGTLTGYTEVESCHLEHVPCTGEELEEIQRLLKEGVLL